MNSPPSIAAVLVEPLQGEGGVNPGDRVFFLNGQKNILLILMRCRWAWDGVVACGL